MTERSRTVLISLGISILVVAIVPLLVCISGMMGMGSVSDMGSTMSEPRAMMRPMIIGGTVLFLILVGGVVSLVLGLRGPNPQAPTSSLRLNGSRPA